MKFATILLAPARVGLAATGLGLAAAEQTAAAAREVVGMAADRLDPDSDGAARRQNLVTAAARVPFIVHRVSDLLVEGGSIDRLLREGGIVDTATAEDGVVQRVTEMTDALNKLTPTITVMNQRIGDIEGMVGAANTMAEPVTDLLSSLPKFAMRTANEMARAAQQRPRPVAARIIDVETAPIEPVDEV